MTLLTPAMRAELALSMIIDIGPVSTITPDNVSPQAAALRALVRLLEQLTRNQPDRDLIAQEIRRRLSAVMSPTIADVLVSPFQIPEGPPE